MIVSGAQHVCEMTGGWEEDLVFVWNWFVCRFDVCDGMIGMCDSE